MYDANKVVALPLCDEALNYCTSTALVKSAFIEFRRENIFRYEGQKKQKLARMTLQIEERKFIGRLLHFIMKEKQS